MYFYILFEFQSYMDKQMAWRIYRYVGALQEEIREREKSELLAPVLPVVIYNGDAKWTAPIDLRSQYKGMAKPLLKYQPQQAYYLIDVKRLGAAELNAATGDASYFLRMENVHSREDMAIHIRKYVDCYGDCESRRPRRMSGQTAFWPRNGRQRCA